MSTKLRLHGALGVGWVVTSLALCGMALVNRSPRAPGPNAAVNLPAMPAIGPQPAADQVRVHVLFRRPRTATPALLETDGWAGLDSHGAGIRPQSLDLIDLRIQVAVNLNGLP